MKMPADSEYRLKLARGYLERAEESMVGRQWDRVVGSAQEAVENAGKSILYHYRPIPGTHDIDKALRELLERKVIPEPQRTRLSQDYDAFLDMGKEKHMKASYGDEAAHIPPWELFHESDAQTAIHKARRAVALAENIFEEMTKPPPTK